MKINKIICILITVFFYKNIFPDQLNSNFWPVFHDDKFGFRISYPKDWSFPTIKGKNVKFSISPKTGTGNCNIIAKLKIEAASLTQTQLNESINEIKNNELDWSDFMGIPVSNIKLIESHKAKIVNISEIEILNIPALFATTEVTLDDLNGTYFRKQITALTITPGYAWTITCGTTTYNIDETRKKFNELRPIFNNIFASFTIININNVHSEALNDSQIKQIENIAQSIASTSNANAKIIKESNSLNSFHATAKGRNVIFEYVLQTKNGLSHQELNETDYAIRKEVIPKICMNNVNNPTFDRGLNYTLIYKNTYNEKIAEFKIDKALCSKFNK